MNRSARIATCCVFVATAIIGGFSAGYPQTYELPSNEQVVGYLLQSVNWYRHAYAEQQVANGPAGLIFLDDNRGIELQIVKLSFEFAKSDATLENTAPSPHGGPTLSDLPPSDLAHFIELKNRNDQVRREAIQEVETLKKKIARAQNSERQELKTALEDVEGRLQLLEAFAQTIDDLIGFIESSRAGQAHAGTLDSTIDRLAESIPEMNGPAVLSTTSPVPAADSGPVSGDTGILGLASDVSAMKRKLHVVDEKILLTSDFTLSAENLRNPMAAFVTRSIQSVATMELQTSDLPSLGEQKAHLDTVALELKGLSPAIVALDKQKVLLAEYKSNVLNLRTEIAGQYRQAWKKLVIHLLVVALIISLLLAIGYVSRRLVLRRVQDPNRQRLVGMIQHFLTLCAIAVVIMFVLASDLKSVATYLGLLSAGILLALQNVILASLGSLLLVGKRGIRIGDRVQVSGITGDVINMGLLQFQLREFEVQKQRFTGHVATFSNSLVFVSPAIGLLKLSSAPGKAAASAADDNGTGPDARSASRLPQARGKDGVEMPKI
jgi:protein-S-isoprenylcysteine O-methyltransferase Ste14